MGMAAITIDVAQIFRNFYAKNCLSPEEMGKNAGAGGLAFQAV